MEISGNSSFERLVSIVEILRSPDGCPWDREQTDLSLRESFLEEVYETIEAINNQNQDHIKEELGDVLLHILLLAVIKKEAGLFTLNDIAETLSEKLIRRHPHVFGDSKVETSDEVVQQWQSIKENVESRRKKDSLLDSAKNNQGTLIYSYSLQKKAAKVGFDWDSADEVFKKIDEEVDEIKAAAQNTAGGPGLEEEIGDLLFSVINLSRKYGINPELALQKTNSKFIQRFRYIEKQMKDKNQELKKENLQVMEELWNEAKTR